MKRIIFSVLSVAGLLATVLALSAGTASAAVGNISVVAYSATLTDTAYPGSYVVSWKAQGGCSSTQDGSVSGNIKATGTTPHNADELLGSYSINDDCVYKVSVVYTTTAETTRVQAGGGFTAVSGFDVPTGTRCAATATPATLTSAGGNVEVKVDKSDCVTTTSVVVSVLGFKEGEGYTPDVGTDSEQAVAANTWEVTATPTGKGAEGVTEVAAECAVVSGTTKADAADDGKQKVTLKPVTSGFMVDASARTCEYTIAAKLRNGFLGHGPTASDPGGLANIVWDSTDGASLSLVLGVARPTVYVVQNVSGTPPSGATTSYSASYACANPDASGAVVPPPPIGSGLTSGGIQTIQQQTLIPLRAGRFDVSAGVVVTAPVLSEDVSNRKVLRADAIGMPVPTSSTDSTQLATIAIGNPCMLSVSVSGVPDGCSATSATQTINLATASSRGTIMEFSISCLPPPAEVSPSGPPAPPGASLDPIDTTTTTTPPPDEPTGATGGEGMMSATDSQTATDTSSATGTGSMTGPTMESVTG